MTFSNLVSQNYNRRSSGPSSSSNNSARTKPTKAESRKMQRAKKRTVEIEKINTELKRPSTQSLNNKKDRKMIAKQVACGNHANDIAARREVCSM
jgi:hypothetical protein